MLFRILRKDLKRKKTMNIILLLFVVLASMFVAAGLSNVVTVAQGTEYYLDKAGFGTYMIVTQGEKGTDKLDRFLAESPVVQSYREDITIYSSGKNLKAHGKELETIGTVFLTAPTSKSLTLFDENNREVTRVEPGHVWVKKKFLNRNHISVGDTISIHLGDTEMSFVIDGCFKDAPFGSEIMSNERFLLNEDDFKTFYNDQSIHSLYKGRIVYVTADSERSVASGIAEVEGIMFTGGRSMIKLSYIMTILLALIVLVLSVALIIVAFVVLRFSINLSISEDFHEIGVMKAIGIRNGKIRGIYMIKYLALALVGAAIGGALSFPFGKLLINSVSENMVLGNDSDFLFHIIGTLAVVLLIAWFARSSTRKINKMSPVDAIRNGNSGERFKKKRSRGVRLKNHTERFLAVNDVCCKPKRYLSVFFSIAICTLLVLTIVNTTNTMKSDAFAPTFGARGDLYAGSLDQLNKVQAEGKEADLAYMKEREEALAARGLPCKVKHDVMYKYTIEFDGNIYNEGFQTGLQAEMDDYLFLEGSAPQNKNEVAITDVISKNTGLHIGDSFTVRYDDSEETMLVVATYQTMNNAGDTILLHPEAETDYSHISAMMDYAICFTDAPSPKMIEERKSAVAEVFEVEKKDVNNAEEFCVEVMGVADTMESVQTLLLLITLIVILLVTILMERSFVTDEKTDIALLKAVGFSNRSIIRWHTLRFFICSVAAVVAAVVLSVPVTTLTMTPIFSMMGLETVRYRYDLIRTAAYPVIICVFTVVVSFLVAQITRKIKSSDTAGIE